MTDVRQRVFLNLASKYRERGVLVDTNVLLLFLIGLFQPAMVGHKRLAKYGADDALMMIQYLGRFRRIYTTAHVLAETSNLARQIVGGRARTELFAHLYPLFCMDMPASLKQCDVPGSAVSFRLFDRLGLTDAGLVSQAKSDKLLLTDDLDLYVEALRAGGNAINFTHMREAAGTL